MRWFTPLLMLTIVCTFSARAAENPQELLNHVDDVLRGASSHSNVTLNIVTSSWSRALELEVWSKGKDHTLIRILEPQKERGTATLMADRNIWNFLPKVQRVVQIPASMMSASWMGSHMSNDDLVKQSRLADDYTVEQLGHEERGGQKVTALTLIPKPDRPVVWGKLVMSIRTSDGSPLQITYFDEGGKQVRTLTYSNYQRVKARTIPTSIKMVPLDKPNESSEIVVKAIDFDVPLEDAFFSLRNLQK